jgi:hypothetical protein
MPVFGSGPFPDITFVINTEANPQNYATTAMPNDGDGACATMFLTAQNMPAGEHWLQLVHINYFPVGIPVNSMWPDPSGNGNWLVDNGNMPGQPFYDLTGVVPLNPPDFGDGPSGPWNGTSFFSAYLFIADMDPNTHVITLHDELTWGWAEPPGDPIPEPSTLALFSMSVLTLFYYARRRKADSLMRARGGRVASRSSHTGNRSSQEDCGEESYQLADLRSCRRADVMG